MLDFVSLHLLFAESYDSSVIVRPV